MNGTPPLAMEIAPDGVLPFFPELPVTPNDKRMQLSCRSMYGQLQHVLLRHPSAAFRSQAHLENTWMHFGYESVPDFQTACRDFDAFVDCLERAGACVHLLEDEADSGLDSLYVHDPAITIASGMVVGHMGKPARNQETEAFMNLCQTMQWPILAVRRT